MGSTATKERVQSVEDVRDEELFRRWQHGRDEHARELLVARYMPLTRQAGAPLPPIVGSHPKDF